MVRGVCVDYSGIFFMVGVGDSEYGVFVFLIMFEKKGVVSIKGCKVIYVMLYFFC